MMLTMNPVLADAMKRAGEKIPEGGIIAMSNGTSIACTAADDATLARKAMDNGVRAIQSNGFSVTRGDFVAKGTAGNETIRLAVGGIPFGELSLRTFSTGSGVMVVGFKSASPGSIQTGLKSILPKSSM